MLELWKDTKLERMISTMHDVTTVNTGRKDKKTNMEIKEPDVVVHYNKFMKGVDKADKCLSYYAVLRET